MRLGHLSNRVPQKSLNSARERAEDGVETTAQVISWAILGPAVQWSHGDQSIPKEVMAQHVLTVVVAGLSPVVTVT